MDGIACISDAILALQNTEALSFTSNVVERPKPRLPNVIGHIFPLDSAGGRTRRTSWLSPVYSRFALRSLEKGKGLHPAEQPLTVPNSYQIAAKNTAKGPYLPEANPLDPGGSLTAMQAMLAAEAGDAPLAERKIQEAIAKGKGYQHFHHVAYAVASAYALLDRHEQALQYLRLVADDGFPCYPLFEHDSNLDKLRTDPRFLSFMEEQKKQWEYFRAHL